MLLVCELLIFLMIYYEYRNFNLSSTPIVILGGIYLLFMPLINIIGVRMGFIDLDDKTIFLFTMFLFLFFLTGQVFATVYKKYKKEVISGYIKAKLLSRETIIWKIYIVALASYVINLVQVINKYGINNTKSNAYGLFAHVGFLSRCLLPIIIYYLIEKRRFKYAVSITINIVSLIMFRGKYHLYIPIAGFIVLFLTMKQNIKISRILKVIAIVFVTSMMLFVSVYTIIPNIIAGNTTWNDMSSGIEFSVRHFFHYLFCPFITSNDFFSTPEYKGLINGLRVNFNPFDVLWQQFLGGKDFYSPVISLWPTVEKSGLTANVGGLFSESVLNIGYFPSILYISGIGVIVYYFYTKTILNGKRINTSLCLMGMLMMSFFCNYFTLFANFECIVYCYLVDVFIFDVNFTIGGKTLFKSIKYYEN